MSNSDRSVIAKGTHIKGEITGSDPIEVWGRLEGTAGTEKLFAVRDGGEVQGKIAAEEVTIEGRADGDVRARTKIHLEQGCKVTADLAATRVSIDDGAFFEGNVEMSREGKGG